MKTINVHEAKTPSNRPRRHKMSPGDIDLDAPVDLVVLSVKETAARLSSPRIGKNRDAAMSGVATHPRHEIVTVRPRKQWSYAGHPYLSGDLGESRVDAS